MRRLARITVDVLLPEDLEDFEAREVDHISLDDGTDVIDIITSTVQPARLELNE